MGVPKFFRWISERYPGIAQQVVDGEIPEFDNLYLDMNNIIHPCSHPNDDDPNQTFTEEDIFVNIFRYVDALFQIIKPKKLLFMAVDGCAPRAKMNQQRSRRFRSAREARESREKAQAEGKQIVERFDGNSITPGTEFMVRLSAALRAFVTTKLNSDRQWREVQVIFSGHETPGEGEHKVMDYIRMVRMQPEYDPYTRHCLYGLDADLFLLSLASHEPYFSLLREEIVSRGQPKRTANAEEQSFFLLHIHAVREYLELDFRDLLSGLEFPCTFEQVLGDWVFMVCLVGNDFIPHLPHLHINEGAFQYLVKTYKSVLPQMGGPMNENGTLNLRRLEMFFKAFAPFDYEVFEEKRGIGSKRRIEMSTGRFDNFGSPMGLGDNEDSEFDEDDDEEEAIYSAIDEDLLNIMANNKDFTDYRESYYREKFGVVKVTDQFLAQVTRDYVRTLEWIVAYYFRGVQSWGYFYPHHFSPFVTDFKNLTCIDKSFEEGSAFLPFQQLLAVLPAASRYLLPPAYQGLMTESTSPIIDYYPAEFATDKNGKKQDWEAVVLIPFINSDRLLSAMMPYNESLNEQEQKRNRHLPSMIYRYEPQAKPTLFMSPIPQVLGNIQNCKVATEEIHIRSPLHVHPTLLSTLDPTKHVVGYPTMKFREFDYNLEEAQVKVFQHPSKEPSIILRLHRKYSTEPKQDLQRLAPKFLGRVVYAHWPLMVKSIVISCHDRNCSAKRIEGGQVKIAKNNQAESSMYQEAVDSLRSLYEKKRGVVIPPCVVYLQVCALEGVYNEFHDDSVVTKEKYSKRGTFVPLESCVLESEIKNQLVKGRVTRNWMLKSIYPKGDSIVCISPFPGHVGTIDVHNIQNGHLTVSLVSPVEPDLAFAMRSIDDRWFSIKEMAHKLDMPISVLNRLFSSFAVVLENPKQKGRNNMQKVNIGMSLKYQKKDQQVSGYARRLDDGYTWEYSSLTVKAAKAFREAFPTFFKALKNLKSQQPTDKLLFPNSVDSKANVLQIKHWLREQPWFEQDLVPCGSRMLSANQIAVIEKTVDAFLKDPPSVSMPITRSLPAHCIYHPNLGTHLQHRTNDWNLGDRVVNVRGAGSVPFGASGTVVGIFTSNKDEGSYRLDVVFDYHATELNNLGGCCSERRGARVNAVWLIRRGGSRGHDKNPVMSVTGVWNQQGNRGKQGREKNVRKQQQLQSQQPVYRQMKQHQMTPQVQPQETQDLTSILSDTLGVKVTGPSRQPATQTVQQALCQQRVTPHSQESGAVDSTQLVHDLTAVFGERVKVVQTGPREGDHSTRHRSKHSVAQQHSASEHEGKQPKVDLDAVAMSLLNHK
eukprot:Clim_evm14s239 gene=Clim_evmTU14s239